MRRLVFVHLAWSLAALLLAVDAAAASAAEQPADDELRQELIERARRWEQLWESASMTASQSLTAGASGKSEGRIRIVRSEGRSYFQVTGEIPGRKGTTSDIKRAFDGEIATSLSTTTGPGGGVRQQASTAKDESGATPPFFIAGIPGRVAVSDLLSGDTEHLAEEYDKYPPLRRLRPYDLQVGRVRLEELPADLAGAGDAAGEGPAGQTIPVYTVQLRLGGAEGGPLVVETYYFHRDESYAGPIGYERTFRAAGGYESRLVMRASDFRDVGGGLLVPFVMQSRFGGGERATFTGRQQIESLELNPSVSPDLFRIEFPPGTTVRDRLSDVTYTSGLVGAVELEGSAELPSEEGASAPAGEELQTSAAATEVAGTPAPETGSEAQAAPDAGVADKRGVSPIVLAILISPAILAAILIFALLSRRAPADRSSRPPRG